MKSYYSFLIISIMLMCSSPLSSFGDIITKDGVKIQFFRKSQKKSISKSELTGQDGVVSYENEYIDRIVFSGGNQSNVTEYPTYTVRIYLNINKPELLLKKDYISSYFSKKDSFSLPLYPWINEYGMFRDSVNEDNPYMLGKYLIVIDRIVGSKSERVIDVNYSIHETMVD
jgi:hypothetical protein